MRIRDALRLRTVRLLGLGIFATNIGGYAFAFWLPTAVKGLLTSTGQDADDSNVLNWSTPIYLCGLAGVLLSGWSSDRTRDRKWHCIVGQLGAGTFLRGSSAIPGQLLEYRIRAACAWPLVLHELLVHPVPGCCRR